jgi:DNA repair protein RecO (recombination protein O)
MLSKCKAIVVKAIDFSESSVILKCYTNQYGMQSYLINGVRKNKGSIRPSHVIPLTLLELEAYHQGNKNIQRIKELKCTPVLHTLHFDMVKSAISMFVAEVIYRAIKEENQPDHAVFDFLYNSIQIIDAEEERLTNFPLYFMLQLSRFLGFYPKRGIADWHTGFNFKDGTFETYDPNNPFMLDEVCGEILLRLLDMNYSDFKTQVINNQHRKYLLNALILYYNEHLNGFSNMKSHEILAEVME